MQSEDTNPQFTVKLWEESDGELSEMLSIYTYYVSTSPTTLDLEPPTPQEWKEKISAIVVGGYPVFLLYSEGKLSGYAYAYRYNPKCGYNHVCETTVYIKPELVGKGGGFYLYSKLLQELKKQGREQCIAGITLPNEASVKLHERLGYTKEYELKDIGFKFGKYWNAGWWRLWL